MKKFGATLELWKKKIVFTTSLRHFYQLLKSETGQNKINALKHFQPSWLIYQKSAYSISPPEVSTTLSTPELLPDSEAEIQELQLAPATTAHYQSRMRLLLRIKQKKKVANVNKNNKYEKGKEEESFCTLKRSF